MTDKLQGEVIGFRQWTVDPDLRLASASGRGVWLPGENVARCESPNHGPGLYGEGCTPCDHAPGADCHCGFYALHDPSFWYGDGGHMGGGIAFALTLRSRPLYVAGLVAAWGRLRVHHSGFRAERAKVVALAIPDGKRDAAIARAAAAEYGVPTVPQAELERVASEFGSTMPESLRPEKQSPLIDLAAFYNAMIGPAARGQSSNHYVWSTGGPLGPQPIFGVDLGTRQPPAKPKAKPVPGAVQRARTRQRAYDPRAFLPKRKGGKR